MTILTSILIVLISLAFVVLGLYLLDTDMSNLSKALQIKIGIGCIMVAGALIYFMCEYLLEAKTDLPEEYKAISKDINKPDTLIGYYKNDVLVIEFINQLK